MRKFWTLLLLLLATMLVATAMACGGDDDDDTGDGGADSTATTATGDDSGDDDSGDDDSGDDDAGGGGDDYYTQLAAILNDADVQTGEIASQYGGPYDDDADEIDQTRSAFNETGQVIETTVLNVIDLDPPAEAQSAHDAYIETLQSLLQKLSALSGDLEGISTGAELDDLENQYGPDLSSLSAEQGTNCEVLQALADDAGSGADLGCSTQE